MAEDGPRLARESDHHRLGRQVKSLSFVVRDIEKRLASVEVAAADLRDDVRTGRDVDEALGEAIDQMFAEMTAGR